MLESGNKGYLRTLEAVIAIIVILLFIYTVTPRNSNVEAGVPSNVQSAQDFIFKELSFNESIRKCVVQTVVSNDCQGWVNEVVENNSPFGYTFDVVICDKTACVSSEPPFDKNVYMSDVFISSSLEEQNPKIIRIYMWES